MKVRLLASSFEEDGSASVRQHLASLVINEKLAIDAGSLAMACGSARDTIRDIILSHTHLDHIAGLPLFLDDLFSTLDEPVRVYATAQMIEDLRNHIFNGAIYPDFTALANKRTTVLDLIEYRCGEPFSAAGFSIDAVAVNHNTPSSGFMISDGEKAIAVTGDTAETGEIWQLIGERGDISAIFVECAFPDEMGELAMAAKHLTPKRLKGELAKLGETRFPIYIVNIKPMFREAVVGQIAGLGIPNVRIMDVGRTIDV